MSFYKIKQNSIIVKRQKKISLKTDKKKVEAETETGVPEDLVQNKLKAAAQNIWDNDYKKMASDDQILKMAKVEADKKRAYEDLILDMVNTVRVNKVLNGATENKSADVDLANDPLGQLADHVKCLDTVIDKNNVEDETHKQHIAAILTMPSRVDKIMKTLGDLQMQLSELQKKQWSLLDESTELFQELYIVKPKSEEELQLVANTNTYIKEKFNGLFASIFPNQVNKLEGNMKNASVQELPK